MVITDRDRQVLDFLATWRFGTLEQFQRALIFNNATNTAYKRLLVPDQN